MSKTLGLKPKLSEKTYKLSESRVYAMIVPDSANKHSVARAVEEQFEVSVKSVNIANSKGKTKRIMSLNGKRYMNKTGKRSDTKKAYVTLEKGHSLPFFAAIEEEEKKEQETQGKIDKALEKQAEKDAKPRRSLLRKTKKSDNK